MKDVLSASTVVVRRRGETVIESRLAINRHPVVLPAPTEAGRFEIRESSSANDGKHFALVWAPLARAGEEAQRPWPVLEFREADDARDALHRIERAFTRPVWRKAVRVYQVIGFVVVLLGTLAFWNTLNVPHQPPSSPAMSSTDTNGGPTPAEQAAIAALLERQRAALQGRAPNPATPNGGSVESLPLPGTPASGVPSAQAPAPTPGDAVANALSGKK